jgi:hypothetical protein
MVRMTYTCGGRCEELIITSAYLLYDICKKGKLKRLRETLIFYAIKHMKILHIPTCIIILLVQAKTYRLLSIPFTTHTTTTA